MFGNNQQQDDQSNNTNMDQVASEIGEQPSGLPQPAPAFGLGTNPSSFSPSANPVTLPTPLPPNNSAVSDDPTLPPPDSSDNSVVHPEPSASPTPVGDLDDIKKQALEQLSPLVGKLDHQTPEEKYKTLMMMIQASDNRDLLKDAYAAANAIEDEKVKAEALLAIVNEINYFTQQSHN